MFLMNKFIKTLCIIIALCILLVGCGSIRRTTVGEDDKENFKMALSYLEELNYDIVYSSDKAATITLKKDHLLELPYYHLWAVQEINPADYVDKVIKTYYFTVKNHPLDNHPNNTKYQTNVGIMICENQIIGGYSFPNYTEKPPRGARVYSLHGISLEDMLKIPYQEWRELWYNKFQQ